ncbi:MAG: hypothetical protein P8Y46_04905 [Sulfurovaceae bacterium]
MNTISATIASQIANLNKSLKDEDALMEILKKRLTKKELKLLKLQRLSTDEAIICKELKLTLMRLQEMKIALRKKLNSEKLKQEITLP